MNDEMYDKIKSLQDIVTFRLCEFPRSASQLYSGLEQYLSSHLSTECEHCANEIKSLQENNKSDWETFFSELSLRIIESIIASEKTDLNFSEYVAEYISKLTISNEKILLERSILSKIQKKNSFLQQRLIEIIREFHREYSKLNASLQEEVDKSSKEIIDCFESPFGGAKDNIYAARPEIKISEYSDTAFLGYENFELKDRSNATVFRGAYPIAANRNNLIVISYCSNENPSSVDDAITNARSYATVSDILTNVCFQELCRNIGQNNGEDFHVYVWKSERDNQIDLDKSFEVVKRVSRFISDAQVSSMLQIYSDKYDELNRLTENWARRLSGDQNSFELVVVLYNAEAGKKGLRDTIAKLAKLRKFNIFTVCVCRDNELNDLNEAISNHDNVRLLEPQKNTVNFSTDHIPLGNGGVVKKKNFSDITGLSFSSIASYFTNDLDFKYYSLRMMISPPPVLSTGAIKIPVGTLNKFPYFWYYQSDGTASNAYISGRSGSGKTYLLKNILTYLAQNYTPDEVNVYFCCLADKGKEDMGDLCRAIPHITLSVISTKPSFVQILMNKIEMEYVERGKKFSAMANRLKRERDIEINGIDIDTYHFYCKEFEGEFEPLPTIFVIIDEVDKLLKASDAFKALFKKFCELLRTVRSSGIFSILANQDFNSTDMTSQLLVYHLALQGSEDKTRISRRVTRLEDKTSFDLDNIIVDTSQTKAEKISKSNEELKEIKKEMIQKYGQDNIIKNYFGFLFDESSSSLPGLRETPIIKELFSSVVRQTTKDKLNVFAGITFGHMGDKSLETCFTNPFFFTLTRGANFVDVGNHFLIINESGELNTAFWTQAIYSVLTQNVAKCAISFLDFSFSDEEKNVFCSSGSSLSSIFFPQDIEDLSLKINEWENHAKTGCYNEYDFNILIINIDSAKALFEDSLLIASQPETLLLHNPSLSQSKTEEIECLLKDNPELSEGIDVEFDEDGLPQTMSQKHIESSSKASEIEHLLKDNPELSGGIDTDIDFKFVEDCSPQTTTQSHTKPSSKTKETRVPHTESGHSNIVTLDISAKERREDIPLNSYYPTIKSFDDLKEKLYKMREQMRYSRSRGAYIFLQISRDFKDLLHKKGSDGFIKSFDSCIAFKVKQRIEEYKYLNVMPDEIDEVGYYFPHPASLNYSNNIEMCEKTAYERIIPVSPEAINEIVKEIN